MSSAEQEPPMGREHPRFVPEYTHTDRETERVFTSPFPVAVFGIHEEFFGVGNVIGSIDDNPVIEVQDSKPYCVMGYESWWTCPVPGEIVDKMASGELAIDSVAAYRQRQDDYWATTHLADDSFLDEAGIDPESL